MFKVNNEDTRTMPYFTPSSSVSIDIVEQINASWVITLYFTDSNLKKIVTCIPEKIALKMFLKRARSLKNYF